MNSESNPVSELKQKYIDIIRDSATKAEKEGKLTKAQLNLIYEQKWFKMLAPSSSGGLQLPLPEALKLLEDIARADGSTSWTITRSAVAGWLAGFIDADVVKELFSGDKECIAGSSATNGTAEKTKTGYIVNGTWPQASGTADATIFTGNCVITENGKPVKDEAGSPSVLSFLFLKSEVAVLPTWNALGLVATSSNDFEVKDLKVSEERSFKINAGNAKVSARLYQYPFLQLTEAAMAVNISGMAFHFTDLCEKLFTETKNGDGIAPGDDNMVQDSFEKHLQKLNDARTKLYYATELTWQACMNQQQIKETILYKVSAAAQDLTKRARECVDALYPFCGMQAMDKGSEINRVWRDLHTASHESLLVFGRS